MNALLLSSHSTDIALQNGNAPEWVHLLPTGVFSGRDGRGPYTCNAAQVATATIANAAGKGVPGDYDHQLEYKEKNGQPAPASGWITQVEPRADGLWGKVEWTPKAAAHIVNKEYRYISPVFYHTANGEISSIESFALTNLPNLRLKALSSQTLHLNEETMNIIAVLKTLFGLPAEAADDLVATHAKQVLADAETAKAAHSVAVAAHNTLRGELEKITNSKGTDAELIKAAQSMASAAQPDPSKFVPLVAYEAITKELAFIQSKAAESSAHSLVAAGKAAGKISPAMEDWAKEYAVKDPEGFKAYMSKAPVLAVVSSALPNTAPGAGNASSLSAEQKSVCASLGISEEDFLKSHQSLKAGS